LLDPSKETKKLFEELGISMESIDPRVNKLSAIIEVFKQKALELQERVDAFFVAQYTALKDEHGNPVSDLDVARWYLTHIRIPEASQGFFVEQGMLCAAEDSPYQQGFEAAAMSHEILANGTSPATFPPVTPTRGPLKVNAERARSLGIPLGPELGIEQIVEEALALKDPAPAKP
jgi:ABC-type uncharacterized transport system substrate-binding protein